MKVLINDNIPLSSWNEFIERNAHATPFHTPSFFRFFNSVGKFSATAYAVTEGDVMKALSVVTIQSEKGPAGIFSRRQIVYGGPLAEDDCPAALDLLLKTIDENRDNRIIFSEIRNLSDFSSLKNVFLNNGYRYVPYLNFRVDTTDRESMTQKVSSSRLRQIRKAQQQSVICSEALNKNEVRVFYLLLRDLYRHRLHKPLPTEDFFVKFYEQDLGKYLLVRHNGRIIGGIMCPVLSGRSLYELYVCGRDDENKGLYPGVMAAWSAMEHACSNNIPLFDFMGAGRPDEEYGVRDFKARFGGTLVEYGRFLKIRKPFLYKTGRIVLELMKRTGA